jgi:uncharacterized BrkB/YihY/UPF0761 family membrane protein/uncharacterized membrane protein YvlD (DUF360 family)
VDLPLNDLTALAQRVWGSFLGRCVHRFIRMEGIDRSLVLSSQAFTALIPLLILVSTLAPPRQPDVVARTIITKLGLAGESADSVEQLFQIPSGDTGTFSVASAILLVYSGVSFSRRLQKMYRAAWNREKAGVRGNVFAVLGLAVLLAEVLVVYVIMSVVQDLPGDWLLALPLALLTGVAPWTSVPYLLLNRQVHWRRLLVAGALTATAMAIYGTATTLYMPDQIERYTSQFGLFGVTIAIIGWLLGAAGIVVASTAIGAEFDNSPAPWTLHLKERFRLTDPDLPPPASSAEEALGLTSKDLVLLARVAVTWLVMATAVWISTVVVPGIHVDGGPLTYLWVSLLLGLVNALLGPLLRLAVPSVTWPRLSIVALVANGILLEVTSWLSPNLDIGGLAGSVLGALLISIAIALCEFTVRPFTRAG